MLCTKGVPGARSELRRRVSQMRQAPEGLEVLLDTTGAAEEEAAAQRHRELAPLIALLFNELDRAGHERIREENADRPPVVD